MTQSPSWLTTCPLPGWKIPVWLQGGKQQKIMRKRKHHFLVWPSPSPSPKITEKSPEHPGNTLTRSQENQKECWDPQHAWDSELDRVSQKMWQAEESARICLKDHQADPRRGGCWVRPGEEPCLFAPTPFWRAGWEQPPPPQEKKSLSSESSELQAEGSDRRCTVKHGQSLPVAWWSEQTWIRLSSLQLSISVLMTLPWSFSQGTTFLSFPCTTFLFTSVGKLWGNHLQIQ